MSKTEVTQETALQQFDELVANVTQLVAPAKQVVVQDVITQGKAVETGKAIKSLQKQIEAKRKELVGPYKEKVKEINDFAKKIAAPLEEAETHLKKGIATFEAAEREKREAEQKRIEAEEQEILAAKERAVAEATAGITDDLQKLAVAAKVESGFRGELKSLRAESKEVAATALKGAKQVWTFEVTDPMLVPAAFLVVDETKIREAIRMGIREIPGVKIFQDTQISFGKTSGVTAEAELNAFFGGKKK